VRLLVFLRFSSETKIKVGTLSEVGRDVAFEYDGDFLASGLNIAPFRLPLKPGVQLYDRTGNMETFGVFEDSLPDGWGDVLSIGCFWQSADVVRPFWNVWPVSVRMAWGH